MPRSHGSSIDHLTQLLGKLPGLGPRSARRAVLHLLKRKETLLLPLAQALGAVGEEIVFCEICGNIDTASPCHICCDPRRDKSVLCVVEDVGDLWALDRSETFQGRYHVLGGTLSALDGVSPDDLRIASLLHRVQEGDIKEVILALNATVEGQTTSHYVAERLPAHVTVTALAHGVPVGGELDYLDDGTLAAALKARRHV